MTDLTPFEYGKRAFECGLTNPSTDYTFLASLQVADTADFKRWDEKVKEWNKGWMAARAEIGEFM